MEGNPRFHARRRATLAIPIRHRDNLIAKEGRLYNTEPNLVVLGIPSDLMRNGQQWDVTGAYHREPDFAPLLYTIARAGRTPRERVAPSSLALRSLRTVWDR